MVMESSENIPNVLIPHPVTPNQGSAILSESVRNRDTGEPGISISINFGKFPVSVSVSESIITKIWYPTQWFWAFHQNLCYKTCLTLVSVSESESKFSLFLVSVSVSESTRRRTSLSIGIGIEKAGIAGSWCKARACNKTHGPGPVLKKICLKSFEQTLSRLQSFDHTIEVLTYFINIPIVKISAKSDQRLPRYSDFLKNLTKIWP